MQTHKILNSIAEVPLLKDGNTKGEIFCDATKFRVGQFVILKSDTVPETSLKIDWIVGNKIHVIGSTVLFKVSDNAVVFSNNQDRPIFSTTDVERSTYEDAPIVARRVFNVDEFGNFTGSTESQVSAKDAISLIKYDDNLNVIEIVETVSLVVGSLCKRTFFSYNENFCVIKIYSEPSILLQGDII